MSDMRVTRLGVEVAGAKALPSAIQAGPLPELVQIFLHNWVTSMRIENAWSTDIAGAITGAEERRGLVDKPYRTAQVLWDGMSQQETAAIFMAAQRACNQRLVVPIYPDRIPTTEAVSVGDDALPCSPTYRRFFPGGRIAIARRTKGSATQVEFARILSVASDQIFLDSTLELDWPEGTWIWPLMETEVAQGLSLTVVDSRHGRFSGALREVVGPGGIPPWIPNGDEPEADTYKQIPIWDFLADASSTTAGGIAMRGRLEDSGRAILHLRSGDRPSIELSLSAGASHRAEAARLLRFIDSRQGRVRPFWVMNRFHLWDPVDIQANQVSFLWDGNAVNVDRFIQHIAIRWTDGTTLIREVVEVEDQGGGNTAVMFREELPESRLDLIDIERITAAHLVRMSSDSYTENWLSDEKVTVEVPVVELLRERSFALGDASKDSPVLAPETVNGLFFWAEFPQGAYQPDPPGGMVNANGDQVTEWRDIRPTYLRSLVTTVPPDEAFHERWKFIGASVCRFANYVPGVGKGQFTSNPAEPLWNNAHGMTVFVVAQRRASETYPTDDDFLLSAEGVIDWRPESIRLYDDSGVEVDDFYTETPDALFPRSDWHVLALTWKPGQFARVYRDGDLIGELPRAPVDLPAMLSAHEWLRMANDEGDSEDGGDSACLGVLVWRRALEVWELNGVGTYLTLLPDSPPTWRRIV